MSHITKNTLSIQAYGQTDRGLIRDENEDNLMVDEFKYVFAVADGLGGLPEGSVASAIAVTRLREIAEKLTLNTALPFNEAFLDIHTAVIEAGNKIDPELGIATTLTALQIIDNEIVVCHIGDSGLFLLRGKEFRQLTKDHTMAQDIIDRMKTSQNVSIPDYYYHTLTGCIGQIGDDITPDFFTFNIQAGDRLILYTDGVTKTWKRQELQASANIALTPEELVQQIITVANKRGGPDNTTAIAIFVN